MRSVAADETFDAWLRLPASDTRTIEEFAEQSTTWAAPARQLMRSFTLPCGCVCLIEHARDVDIDEYARAMIASHRHHN